MTRNIRLARRRAVRRAAAVAALVLALTTLVAPAAQAAEELTVTLAPPTAATYGTPAAFAGVVSLQSVGLPSRDVHIHVDGVDVRTITTNSSGRFNFTVVFTTVGLHTVQTKVDATGLGALTGTSPLRTVAVSAPTIDPTHPTDLFETTSFLYTGTSPAQTGVAGGTIEESRVAVVPGRVRSTSGAALDGVEVTVADHPEYGSTTTRDGGWALAVNGDAPLVLRYRKAGYLTVERKVTPDARDYTTAPDVTMTSLDTVSTVVDAGASGSVVHAASTVTDADGSRRARLYFPPGLQATMTLANGTTTSLSSLTVRATEYTVGTTGEQAMPGELPFASGYTYAAEYSVDEAVAAGATSVAFDRPVYAYVENFLGFPVGTNVPVGTYNLTRHAWVPDPDGRVVAIVGETGGVADVDADGDGTADGAAALAALGLTIDERQRLATAFEPGDELWRAPRDHFSPVDMNFPVGWIDDARPGMVIHVPVDAPCRRPGSIIGCENQTLGETVPIAGTGVALEYDSGRMPGYAFGRTQVIPLTGPELPVSLVDVMLEVDVAGRRFESHHPAAPNTVVDFTWDGKDAFGRTWRGAAEATVRIAYGYRGYYMVPASSGLTGIDGASFGRPGTIAVEARTRRLRYYSQAYTVRLGAPPAEAQQTLGGWNVAGHHTYDPDSKTLHLSDGRAVSARSVLRGLSTVAGNGARGTGRGTYTGDGGAALSAGFSDVQGIAVAPDGSVYLADAGNGVVRRISRTGTVSTVAGGGAPASGNGDGGPATSAELGEPVDVALGPDGSLYVADTGGRVRKVSPASVISTIAGGGIPADGLGDNGPATAARLLAPRGVAVSADGTVFVTDTGHDRVRKVTPAGVISTVAGGGTPADGLGDGLPGPQAALSGPTDVVVGGDGDLYVSDTGHDRVRHIAFDGGITTVAGNGGAGSSGDGGDATAAAVGSPTGLAWDSSTGTLLVAQWLQHRVRAVEPGGYITIAAGTGTAGYTATAGVAPATAQLREPRAVAVAPDGSTLLADVGNFRIRRIASALPGASTSDIAVPSPDGSELYIFNRYGRHERTVDTTSRLTVTTFQYDTAGRLVGIDDRFANHVTFEWDGAGAPEAVVGPFGQRTALTVDAAGYLETVTNPSSEMITLSYGAGGLLTSLRDARGKTSTFEYDGLGRLWRDTSADGRSTTLTRESTPTSQTVHASSAEGRVTTFRTTYEPDGAVRREVVAAGLTSSSTTSPDGTVTRREPNGTTTTTTRRPDPRWGLVAAYPGTITQRNAAGVTKTSTVSRAVTLTDPADPLSVSSLTTGVTVIGQTTTTTHDAATRTMTTSTPQGRTKTVTFDAAGLVTSSRDGTFAETTYGHDPRGRLTTITVGSGSSARTTTIEYGIDGYVAAVHGAGRTTSFDHDATGRVLTTTLPDSERTSATYDPTGNLATLTPPDRPAHAFDYTDGGVVHRYRPPDVDAASDGATTNEHNLDRQPTVTHLPDGRDVTYGYDAFGRAETVAVARGTTVLAYSATTGEVTGVSGPDGQSVTVTYDTGQPVTFATSGVVASSATYSYNTQQRVAGISLNGGAAEAFSYDADGLVTAANGMTLTWRADAAFVSSTTLGTVTTGHTYNTFADPATDTANIGGVTAYSASYTPDGEGRVAELTETVGGSTATTGYTYDDRGRLTDVVRGGTTLYHYTYDGNGARTGVTTPGGTTAATYDAQDRLLTRGATSYTHHSSGQLATATTGGSTTTYSYDEEGRLTAVALPDGRALTYLYDGLGRRVAKRVDGVLTTGWVYGAGPRPLAETNGAGAVTATFTYARTGVVPDVVTKGGIKYRIVSDRRGSPRLVVNATTGAVVQRIAYSPFGETVEDTNPGFQPFGFAGGLADRDTGLVHFVNRDYDLAAGRFTTKDPLGFGGGTDFYAYAGNDPVNNSDPAGLRACIKCGSNGLTASLTAVNGTRPMYVATEQQVAEGNVCLYTDLSTAREVALTRERPDGGVVLYRLWGGLAPQWGQYWTSTDPRQMIDPRRQLGLPPANTCSFLTMGYLADVKSATAVRPARNLDGTTIRGPQPVLEWIIQDPPTKIIHIQTFPVAGICPPPR